MTEDSWQMLCVCQKHEEWSPICLRGPMEAVMLVLIKQREGCLTENLEEDKGPKENF